MRGDAALPIVHIKTYRRMSLLNIGEKQHIATDRRISRTLDSELWLNACKSIDQLIISDSTNDERTRRCKRQEESVMKGL